MMSVLDPTETTEYRPRTGHAAGDAGDLPAGIQLRFPIFLPRVWQADYNECGQVTRPAFADGIKITLARDSNLLTL
jgi:hypothetical protein